MSNTCKNIAELTHLSGVFGGVFLFSSFLHLIFTSLQHEGCTFATLLGSTGNNPSYEPMLKTMGAADTRDDVFASVCYCPIIDLDHADMAYEWLYGEVDGKILCLE